VQGLPLLVEAGYGCSQSVASNVFVRTKPYLLFLNNCTRNLVSNHGGVRLANTSQNFPGFVSVKVSFGSSENTTPQSDRDLGHSISIRCQDLTHL
jgi:hypothetical protein